MISGSPFLGATFLVFTAKYDYLLAQNLPTLMRTLILTLFGAIFLGCTVSEPTESVEETKTTVLLKTAGLEKEDIGVVSGVLFDVENFDIWLEAYRKSSKGLIIALRNVDAPKITLVFEGFKTKAEADDQVKHLSSEVFIKEARSQGDPISSYYKIEYFDKIPVPDPHFFALSYSEGGDPERNWIDFVTSNKEVFEQAGIEPAGIGTNPDDKNQAYLLFRQKDFVSFRKSMNSPNKINKFLDKLDLPEHTLLSYWVRISHQIE